MDFESELEKYTLGETENGSEKEAKPEYTGADAAFALLAFVLGYLFICWVFVFLKEWGWGLSYLP